MTFSEPLVYSKSSLFDFNVTTFVFLRIALTELKKVMYIYYPCLYIILHLHAQPESCKPFLTATRAKPQVAQGGARAIAANAVHATAGGSIGRKDFSLNELSLILAGPG